MQQNDVQKLFVSTYTISHSYRPDRFKVTSSLTANNVPTNRTMNNFETTSQYYHTPHQNTLAVYYRRPPLSSVATFTKDTTDVVNQQLRTLNAKPIPENLENSFIHRKTDRYLSEMKEQFAPKNFSQGEQHSTKRGQERYVGQSQTFATTNRQTLRSAPPPMVSTYSMYHQHYSFKPPTAAVFKDKQIRGRLVTHKP